MKKKNGIILFVSAMTIILCTSFSFATTKASLRPMVDASTVESNQNMENATPEEDTMGSPRMDIVRVNVIRNKVYKGYNYRVLEYWSDTWMKASKYEVKKGS